MSDISYDCCSEPSVSNCSDGMVCNNCHSLVSELVIEDTCIGCGMNDKQRERKYKSRVLELNFPWYVRETLLDCFPKIQNHFYVSDRTNFININQLIISLLNMWGYSNYAYKIKALKTKARTKAVDKFVREAFGIPDKVEPIVRRLEDVLDLIELKSDFVSEPRLPPCMNQVFTSLVKGNAS